MTNEQINIAIAQHLGWKVDEERETHGFEPLTDGCRTYAKLPDYCNDLNAMHEAEKVLTADQWYEYDRLMPLRDPQKMHVTATQRAEAFLTAIGK